MNQFLQKSSIIDMWQSPKYDSVTPSNLGPKLVMLLWDTTENVIKVSGSHPNSIIYEILGQVD